MKTNVFTLANKFSENSFYLSLTKADKVKYLKYLARTAELKAILG